MQDSIVNMEVFLHKNTAILGQSLTTVITSRKDEHCKQITHLKLYS